MGVCGRSENQQLILERANEISIVEDIQIINGANKIIIGNSKQIKQEANEVSTRTDKKEKESINDFILLGDKERQSMNIINIKRDEEKKQRMSIINLETNAEKKQRVNEISLVKNKDIKQKENEKVIEKNKEINKRTNEIVIEKDKDKEIKQKSSKIIMEKDKEIKRRVNEGLIKGAKDIEPLKDNEYKNMSKCICKISGNTIGTGFFCKIKYKNNLTPVLITNYHVIDEKFIKNNNIFKIAINNKSKVLNINENDIIYSSIIDKYDIIIIKLKEEEINDYLEIDEDIFNINSENMYKNEQIYITFSKFRQCLYFIWLWYRANKQL